MTPRQPIKLFRVTTNTLRFGIFCCGLLLVVPRLFSLSVFLLLLLAFLLDFLSRRVVASSFRLPGALRGEGYCSGGDAVGRLDHELLARDGEKLPSESDL